MQISCEKSESFFDKKYFVKVVLNFQLDGILQLAKTLWRAILIPLIIINLIALRDLLILSLSRINSTLSTWTPLIRLGISYKQVLHANQPLRIRISLSVRPKAIPYSVLPKSGETNYANTVNKGPIIIRISSTWSSPSSHSPQLHLINRIHTFGNIIFYVRVSPVMETQLRSLTHLTPLLW